MSTLRGWIDGVDTIRRVRASGLVTENSEKLGRKEGVGLELFKFVPN